MALWINLCSFLLHCVSWGLCKGPSVCHYIRGSLCPSFQLNYSCAKALLISVEAAAFLRYEPAVMWLYRDQSSLYSTSQCHILNSPPQTPWHSPSTLLLCSIFQSLPLSHLFLFSVFCVLLSVSDLMRTDTLFLLRTGFLFSLSYIALYSTLFLPLQPLAVKKKNLLPHIFEALFPPQSFHHTTCSHPACTSVSLLYPWAVTFPADPPPLYSKVSFQPQTCTA